MIIVFRSFNVSFFFYRSGRAFIAAANQRIPTPEEGNLSSSVSLSRYTPAFTLKRINTQQIISHKPKLCKIFAMRIFVNFFCLNMLLIHIT